jgi:hypothetical protein
MVDRVGGVDELAGKQAREKIGAERLPPACRRSALSLLNGISIGHVRRIFGQIANRGAAPLGDEPDVEPTRRPEFARRSSPHRS